MALLTYTTYDQIRAVLGVSKTELPDAVLSLPLYDLMPEIYLEDISVELPTRYSEISALPTKTTTQQRLLDLTELYVPYRLAKELLTSLPMFGVRQLSDGRAEFQRQADTFQDTRDGVDATLQTLRYRLAGTLLQLYPTVSVTTSATRFSMTVASTLGTDPVTGS